VSETLTRTLADQAAIEDRGARVAQLRSMTPAQLAAVLGGDPAEAEPWVRAAGASGIPQAQVRLGRMLLEGQGVPKDQASALRRFEHAAKTGDGDAMNMAGRCYENGWGAPADHVQAAGWYRRSAEAGHDWGEYNYAHMLFDGRGVAQDRTAAFAWYRKAADSGHARAMNLVARCLEAGWGVAVDPMAADRWYERSARAGYFRAQYNHALALFGRGQIDEGRAWLRQAFDGGDGAIRQRIASLGAI
jgi:TPR repeat protein